MNLILCYLICIEWRPLVIKFFVQREFHFHNVEFQAIVLLENEKKCDKKTSYACRSIELCGS